MTLAKNPRAKFDYDILKTYEAGIVLTGQEVKSVRAGNVSLKGAYATLKGEEVWLLNAHIGAYKKAGSLKDYDPTASRKLLLHGREIKELMGKIHSQGLTLIPVSLYTKGRRLKVELGLARGRKKYEKREVIKKRAVDREIREKLRRSY
ncbi:SsrA-binding protein SmpB [Candidatus Uhrbacteria bacterium]|nr:SsrA-binding protein SmpB [Candidatus Uhrbacteria bacterium]